MSGSQTAWDRELDERASPSPLLQTWGWGEVQSRAGWTIREVHGGTAVLVGRDHVWTVRLGDYVPGSDGPNCWCGNAFEDSYLIA